MQSKIASMERKHDQMRTHRKYAICENRKYARYKSQVCQVQIASMPCTNRKYAMYKSQVCHVQIASIPCTNRKYAMYKSQVCQVQIASIVPNIIASMLPDINIASMLPDIVTSMMPLNRKCYNYIVNITSMLRGEVITIEE